MIPYLVWRDTAAGVRDTFTDGQSSGDAASDRSAAATRRRRSCWHLQRPEARLLKLGETGPVR